MYFSAWEHFVSEEKSDPGLWRDVISGLLDSWPDIPLRVDRQCDLGQVLHGIARSVQVHYGAEWTQRVALLVPSTLERQELLKLQNFPDLMLTVLRLAEEQ